jgi:hypothetical protein
MPPQELHYQVRGLGNFATAAEAQAAIEAARKGAHGPKTKPEPEPAPAEPDAQPVEESAE